MGPERLSCSDSVPARDVEYARAKVLAALRHASEPVLHARAALSLLVDPAVVCPAVAQVNVDLNGRTIRSSVARPTLREAIDALHDRLQERLQRFARDWEALRGGRPGDEQWRHGSRTAERPEYFPRALDERGLVRHKTFTPSVATVDEAAFDMEMLDYEFHLFTEMGSGQVSVLTRLAGGGFQLAQAEPHPSSSARASPRWWSVASDRRCSPTSQRWTASSRRAGRSCSSAMRPAAKAGCSITGTTVTTASSHRPSDRGPREGSEGEDPTAGGARVDLDGRRSAPDAGDLDLLHGFSPGVGAVILGLGSGSRSLQRSYPFGAKLIT